MVSHTPIHCTNHTPAEFAPYTPTTVTLHVYSTTVNHIIYMTAPISQILLPTLTLITNLWLIEATQAKATLTPSPTLE